MKKGIAKRCVKICKSYLQRFLPLIVWISFTLLIFWNTYKKFETKPEYFYLRCILGRWLCISRGTAPVITTCTILTLIPVCRSIHTILHNVFAKISPSFVAAWLAKVKNMHITCAATLILFSIMHSGAHLMNVINFSKHYMEIYPEINLAKYRGENPALLICTWTGSSGIAMLILLLIISFTSTSKFRTKYFNSFYITHHLFILYLLLLFTHPFSGVLKQQSNVNQHLPGCIFPPNDTGTYPVESKHLKQHPVYCKSAPKFKCIPSQSWIWVAISLMIYSYEIGYRKYKNSSMEVVQACHVIGKAIYLKIKCPENFYIHPGQYILLQCHKISHIEWHPFTITKCPTKENRTFELLISIRGDWTKSLYNLLKTPFIFNQNRSYISRFYHEPMKFLIDGPFSSPMQNITNCKFAICVAGGIGITSYVAKLLQFSSSDTNYPKRLHLIWLTRDPKQLMWYAKLLRDTLDKFWDKNEPDRFQIQLFVTKVHRKEEVNLIFSGHKLRSRIHIGRPNWKEEFRIFSLMYSQSKINIFCCGPKTLSKEVQKRCLVENSKGNNYNFIKEGF